MLDKYCLDNRARPNAQGRRPADKGLNMAAQLRCTHALEQLENGAVFAAPATDCTAASKAF